MTTLVLGATGKTGRRVVDRLRHRGTTVRPGSRSGLPPFDWEREDTWRPAVDGADRVYLSFHPDLAVPGASEKVAAFTELAVAQGVSRLVLLSGRGEPEARRSEQVVQNAGVAWTIVRASWFNQNFSESYLADAVRAGHVVLPVGQVGEPFVDADDIAAVAVAALTEPGHDGQVYEVTGPRLLTFARAVAEIAEASGRDLRFTEVGIDQYRTLLAEAAVPADVVSLVSYLFTELFDGRNAATTDGVTRALGRAPRDFGDYALVAAASGVWSAT